MKYIYATVILTGYSNYSNSDNDTKEKTQDLVKYSKKNIFLYDKKCRTVLHLGVLYKNLTKAAANSINLDKITSKIQSMIDKNQIYLRDAGPIILGVTKIVVKKSYILLEEIEELTKLRINSKEQIRTINKQNKENVDDDEENKNSIINLNNNQILGNEIKESTGTTALNINSLDDDIYNLRNSHLLELQNSIMKNKKGNNNFSFSKDIVELNNDTLIRRTIQKMSKINDSDIKKILSTNKKYKDKKELQFDTENKNSKTLQNLRDMLFNKNNNTNNNLSNNINLESNSNFNYLDNDNIDNNNKDVEGFFTVIKSQIQDNTNNNNTNNNINEILNDDTNNNNDINFNFDINVNDLQKDKFNSNIKYKIDDDSINNNLKSKKNKKTLFMLRGKLKYDDDIEMDMDDPMENLSNKQKKEYEKNLEIENQLKLDKIQFIFNSFYYDKNILTSFQNEKYEYLLPNFLEAEKTGNENQNENTNISNDSEIKSIRKDENMRDSINNLNVINKSNIESNEKNDITRLNRLTTSNKKKISLGNFESENNTLLHNLSRMTLDKNDFKGSTSFIERIKAIDEDKNKSNDKGREDNNDNVNNNFNDLDLIDQDDNINNDTNNQNENIENKKNKDIKYLGEDIKEEEDVVQLKEDLEKNIFKNKNNISFNKIRNKLDNSEKFVEPKLFYDLLLLAQKGDIEMTQKKIMNNESINI